MMNLKVYDFFGIKDFGKVIEVMDRETNKDCCLAWGVRDSNRKCYDKIAIDDFGFIYEKENVEQLNDFRKQLDDAGITEFVITERSTGLMSIIHALDSVNIKIDGIYKLEKKEYDFSPKEEKIEIVNGLLMKVL